MHPSEQPSGYDWKLLVLLRMGDKDSPSAEEHFQFLQFVLRVSGKSREYIVARVGASCSTTEASVRRAGHLFVNCFSQRYKLAIKDIIKELIEIFERV